MPKEEITSYYDANIKSKLIEIVKRDITSLETAHVNDVEEFYFLERDGAFSDFVHWRKKLKTDVDFVGFVSRGSNFYNESKLKQPPADSSIINFNLRWSDFTSDKHFENNASEKELSYFLELKEEFANDMERDSAILSRVEELKSEKKWGLKLDEACPEFAMVWEPKQIKTHRDFMLDEVVWLATDIHMEKRWKRNVAKKFAISCKRVHREREDLRNQSLQMDLRAKKQAKLVSKLVSDFWSNINKIQQIKVKKFIEYQKQQELNERLKNFVNKTQQYSSNIANKLTAAGSTSNTSENDFSGDEFDPSDIHEDSDQLEEDMKDFIDEENMIDNGKLDEELNHLNCDGKMSLDDLISNLPQEYLDEYRKNTENYNTNQALSYETCANRPPSTSSLKRESSSSCLDVVPNDDEQGDLDEASSVNLYNNVIDADDDSNSIVSSTSAVCYDNENPNIELMVENASRYKPTGTTISTANCNIEQPFLLRGTLREYQLVGLNWLLSLHDNNLNGILADEMGLGKTIQTISLIAHLAGTSGEWGPHLIIVPSSVILNWECEFKKWCPSLKVLAYYGRTKERKAKRHGWSKENAFHVCITSFQLAIQDNIMFKKRRWYYLIIDEAHNIRNSKSVRWNMLLGLNTQRRLLLTGTPLQNNLMELWSLLHFLMPQLFKCEDAFRQWFAQPISSMVFNESSVDETTITKLHHILRPFILRRLKCEVELQIPKKYEHVIKCELSPRQRSLYNEYMMLDSTKSVLQAGSFMSVMQILIQLRKVCNHPDLFEPRPVVSAFVVDPPCSGFRACEIASICDLSQSYLSFVDEARMMLLKSYPSLKAGLHITNFLPKDISTEVCSGARKRKADDASSLVGEENISTTIGGSSLSNQKQKNYSVNHYVKRFSHLIDAYIEELKKSTTTNVSSAINNGDSLINGNNFQLVTDPDVSLNRHIGLIGAKRIPRSKLCSCTYKCDGCGGDEFRDSISVPYLRAVVENQPSNRCFVQRLKKQAIKNMNRILVFSNQYQPTNHFGNYFDTKLLQWCNINDSPNNSPNVDRSSYLNSLFNVSTNVLEQYIPFIIREVLISAMRAIAFSFELTKYSSTYSLRSTHIFLHRLSCLMNSFGKRILSNDGSFTSVDHLWKVFTNRQLSFPQTRLIQYDCGKLQFLDDFLKKLFQEGHRVLIFTQMSKMLDILEKFLSYHHFTYLRLDGSTKIEHRQYMMDLFNNDESIFAFILSTRAGGLGLNLTGADTVIFYDNDWNPTVDAQAQDRCHRIGQIRDVHIYRLVCRNTVEENILKRAQQKRMLADVTIEGGNFTVSQLEENFIADIFGSHSDFESVPSVSTIPPVDSTANFENVLKCVEKIEGIDEVDVLPSVAAARTASSRQQPSAYDDFCEEIFSIENDMLPVERFALYYLESLLTEELEQPDAVGEAEFATKDDGRNIDDTKMNIDSTTSPITHENGPSDGHLLDSELGVSMSEHLKLSSVTRFKDTSPLNDTNIGYFKPTAELFKGDGCDLDAPTNENIHFGSFLLNDVKKMSSGDGDSLWLPRGTNYFSIINDVYSLGHTPNQNVLTCGPLIKNNSNDKNSLETNLQLIVNEGIYNFYATALASATFKFVASVELNDGNQNFEETLMTNDTSVLPDQLLLANYIRSCFNLDDNSMLNAHLINSKLKMKDLVWLVHPNFYDYSLNDGNVDFMLSSLNHWNESYYYADNPSKDQTPELLFQDDSLLLINTLSKKYVENYPDIFDKKYADLLSLMVPPKNLIKPKCPRSVCCYSDLPHLSRNKNASYNDKCLSTFTVMCPKRIMAQLYGVMVDVLEKETDPINWEFFRFTFSTLTQIPFPVSHRHFHVWSLSNQHRKVRSSSGFKCDKILNRIANISCKPYVRTKNLKHQRMYKDFASVSSVSLSNISKYSQFHTCSNIIQKDSQLFNNKRNTLSRIYDRIKKKRRLVNSQQSNQFTNVDSSTGGNSSGGYVSAQKRLSDQTKQTTNSSCDKLRPTHHPSQQHRLPSLISSVRKRRTLLESNLMMYNPDKIAKVKQHVSRISINDHLLLYRDLGSKAIKHVKFVDGKFIKIIPSMPPPVAVSHSNKTSTSRIGSSNSVVSRASHLHPPINLKTFSNSSASSSTVCSTLSSRSQFSNLPNIPSNNSGQLGYQPQNVARAMNYQRLHMPKTATISMSNNSTNPSNSSRLSSTVQHKPNVSTASTISKNPSNYGFNQVSGANANTLKYTSQNNQSATFSGTTTSSTNLNSNIPSNNNSNHRTSSVHTTNGNNHGNNSKIITNKSSNTIAMPLNLKLEKVPQPSSSVGGLGSRVMLTDINGEPTTPKSHSNSTLPDGNTSRITQPSVTTGFNTKLVNVPMPSPQKISSPSVPKNQMVNLNRPIAPQQQSQFINTPEKQEISPEIDGGFDLVHFTQQRRQINLPNIQNQISNQQQFHLAQKHLHSYSQSQQQQQHVDINSSPLKFNNYNQPLSSASNPSNSFSFVDNHANSGARVDSAHFRSNDGTQSNFSLQFNQVGTVSTSNDGSMINAQASNSLTNIQSTPLNSNNPPSFNNSSISSTQNIRQTISNCQSSNPQMTQPSHQHHHHQQQQQQQLHQQRNTSCISNVTKTQHALQRLHCLQQQLVSIHQQQPLIPSHVFQHLQQQNLLAQQQLQQQLAQLQHSTSNEQTSNAVSQPNIGYDMVSNSGGSAGINNSNINNTVNIPIFNNSSNNSNIGIAHNNNNANNNLMLHQIQSNQNIGANASSSCSMAPSNNSNMMHKNQVDVYTILNNIINSGGNVPAVLQNILGGKSNEINHSITPNNRPVAAPSSGVIVSQNSNVNTNNQPNTPASMNLLNQANPNLYMQQSHPLNIIQNVPQQQRVNSTSRVLTGNSISSIYHNVKNSQQNAPINIAMNHSSFNDANTANVPIESGSAFNTNVINQNTFKNIPQNDLFNFLMESKSSNMNNSIQHNYTTLQKVIQKYVPNVNPLSRESNFGCYNSSLNNSGSQH